MTAFYHADQPHSETRVCSKCKQEKRVETDFRIWRGKPYSQCRACEREYTIARQEKYIHKRPILPEPTKPNHKVCNTCFIEKPYADFQFSNQQKDGYAGRCKSCMKDEYYANHDEIQAKRKVNEDARRDRIREQNRIRTKTAAYREQTNTRNRKNRAEKRIQREQELLLNPPPPKLTKICPTCNPPTEKPLSEFGISNKNKDRHNTYCKECVRKMHNSEEAKTKRREYDRTKMSDPEYREAKNQSLNEWRREHPEYQQEYTMRRNARKKVATTGRVSYKSVLAMYGYYCYLCNQSIDPNAVKKSPGSLTYDHIIPLQPRPGEPQGTHCIENIRPAHLLCNQRKHNRPLETLTDYDRRGLQ